MNFIVVQIDKAHLKNAALETVGCDLGSLSPCDWGFPNISYLNTAGLSHHTTLS